jgi:hypothetical protein
MVTGSDDMEKKAEGKGKREKGKGKRQKAKGKRLTANSEQRTTRRKVEGKTHPKSDLRVFQKLGGLTLPYLTQVGTAVN